MVYFLDNILGCGWWVMVLELVLVFAVLVVRGKPYGAEQIVTVLFPKAACCSAWLGPLLAFTWNVVSGVEFLNFDVIAITSVRRRRLIPTTFNKLPLFRYTVRKEPQNHLSVKIFRCCFLFVTHANVNLNSD